MNLQTTLNIIKKISLIPRKYIFALTLTIERKNCASMARETNFSKNALYEYLKNGKQNYKKLQKVLINLIREYSKQRPGILIFDDTMLSKRYAKNIMNLTYDWSGSTKQITKGYSIVVAAWTNGLITIPFDFSFWLNKKDAGDQYKKKPILMMELVDTCIAKKIPFDFVSLDGAYISEETIKFLKNRKVQFVGRFHRHRKVTIKNETISIKHHKAIMLYRNSRSKKAYGKYGKKKIHCTFVAQKRKCTKNKGSEYETVFIVTTLNGSAKEIIEAYDLRWSIETTFRRLKQKFGIHQNQTIQLDKQKAHIFAAFVADVFANIMQKQYNTKSPDQWINQIRRQKINPNQHQIYEFNDFALA